MKTRSRTSVVVGLAVVAALAVSACSSEGGQQAQEAAADMPEMKVAMITHAGAGDTFWDIVRKGAEDAAARYDIELVYSAEPEAGKQATLVDNAVDQQVDGIALTLSKPEAMKGAIKRARDAGIPVVGLNSGIDQWESLGALSYFGSDEDLAGKAVGERLNKDGTKHALCVIVEQGNVALETRCGSMKDSFNGKTTNLYVNGADMSSAVSTLQAKLRQDSSIDYVIAMGAPWAITAPEAVKAAGSSAKVATYGLSSELVEMIKNGSVQWAIDIQPYLQGYLSVEALWLYKYNRNFAGGGTEPILTGPVFVDKSNVDDIAEFAKRGTR